MTKMNAPIELIGMMDSPFVRRVAIALNCYGLHYKLNPLSVYSEPERLAAINPTLTVPVLRVGELQLLDSRQILQWIDAQVPDAWLAKYDEIAHANMLALSDVLALKMGELYREKAWRKAQFRCPQAISRAVQQISAALEMLEEQVSLTPVAIRHPGIALASSYRFARDVAQYLDVVFPNTLSIDAYCAQLEATPYFLQCA